MIIFIIGMHRSGTSCLAGLLHNNGIIMGENLMGCINMENPKGFYENIPTKKINDSLLNNYKVDLWHIPDYEIELNESPKIEEIINEYESKYSEWGFKDPRFCLTFPAWYKVIKKLGLENKLKIIHIERKAEAVSQSLINRKNIKDLKHGIKLNQMYNYKIVDFLESNNIDYLSINYKELIENKINKLETYLSKNINPIFIDPELNRCGA
jgi:hypothetical protein